MTWIIIDKSFLNFFSYNRKCILLQITVLFVGKNVNEIHWLFPSTFKQYFHCPTAKLSFYKTLLVFETTPYYGGCLIRTNIPSTCIYQNLVK